MVGVSIHPVSTTNMLQDFDMQGLLRMGTACVQYSAKSDAVTPKVDLACANSLSRCCPPFT